MGNNDKKQNLNYAALKKEISAGEPGRLYLFWGEEDYLIRDIVRTVRNMCVTEETADFDEKRLSGPALDLDALEEALNAMPFFGGHIYIELSGISFELLRSEDDRKRLASLLSDIPEWCTVVITPQTGTGIDKRLTLYKTIDKLGKAVEITVQEHSLLCRWVAARFKAHGKTVDRDAVERLIFLSGELMSGLIPEIEKISAFCKNDNVTVREVNAVAHHLPEAIGFELTDRLAAKDFDGAAALLAEMMAGDREPMEAFGMLGWWLRQLFTVRVCMDAGKTPPEIGAVIGANSYKATRLIETAKRFTTARLRRGVRLCAELCAHTRDGSGLYTPEEALKELLVRFALEDTEARLA